MIRHIGPVAIVLSMIALAPAAGQQPVFRATRAEVAVDVSVKNGAMPVAGLVAADFELDDDGVRQPLEAVSVENVPIDLTLVVDLSNSIVPDAGKYKSDIQKIGRMLRPGDRVRLVSFATDVRQVSPMQPADIPLPVDRMAVGGATALNDGVLYALSRPSEDNRRHLVVVFTDGEDTWSVLDEAALPELASRSNALLSVVLSDPYYAGDPRMMQKHAIPSRDALVEAAARTGGDTYRLNDALKGFTQLYDEFRQSYVLYYPPTNVPGTGWHEIVVRVPKCPTCSIRARRGYFPMMLPGCSIQARTERLLTLRSSVGSVSPGIPG